LLVVLHMQALADAIRRVTDVNPDLSVEKIEIQTSTSSDAAKWNDCPRPPYRSVRPGATFTILLRMILERFLLLENTQKRMRILETSWKNLEII